LRKSLINPQHRTDLSDVVLRLHQLQILSDVPADLFQVFKRVLRNLLRPGVGQVGAVNRGGHNRIGEYVHEVLAV